MAIKTGFISFNALKLLLFPSFLCIMFLLLSFSCSHRFSALCSSSISSFSQNIFFCFQRCRETNNFSEHFLDNEILSIQPKKGFRVGEMWISFVSKIGPELTQKLNEVSKNVEGLEVEQKEESRGRRGRRRKKEEKEEKKRGRRRRGYIWVICGSRSSSRYVHSSLKSLMRFRTKLKVWRWSETKKTTGRTDCRESWSDFGSLRSRRFGFLTQSRSWND